MIQCKCGLPVLTEREVGLFNAEKEQKQKALLLETSASTRDSAKKDFKERQLSWLGPRGPRQQKRPAFVTLVQIHVNPKRTWRTEASASGLEARAVRATPLAKHSKTD